MKKTALYHWHEQAGARIIDFGGYLMPVQYSGIIAEHRAVRSAAGLFDVSHMGNFYVTGERSEAFLQYMVTNDLSKVRDGEAQYNLMLYPNGGVVDDLIIYRLDSKTFFSLSMRAIQKKIMHGFSSISAHLMASVLRIIPTGFRLLRCRGRLRSIL